MFILKSWDSDHGLVLLILLDKFYTVFADSFPTTACCFGTAI